MKMKRLIVMVAAAAVVLPLMGQVRSEMLLKDGWKFVKGDVPGAEAPSFDDSAWESVSVPHDWAIKGPFDIENDLQKVAVVQNGEKVATLKTGRTGGLPYMGTGWYRTGFEASPERSVELIFDGAMSEAQVYVNGERVCQWPYGYASFHCDVTPYLNADGRNVLAVRLENRPFSSRWYPGAGLFRNVHVVSTSRSAHVPVWGTYGTTPSVSAERASVRLEISAEAEDGLMIEYRTSIKDPEGREVAARVSQSAHHAGVALPQQFVVDNPMLWSPETPWLYRAETELYVDGALVDRYDTRFGIRRIEFIPEVGFCLNGERRKFQGVCNHHDLGPLGAAVNVSALRHQLELLKDMGCDAIRTSHNMPAPELVDLCDEMGLMMMVEPFDEWGDAKCQNGYHRFFDLWAETDMVNMIHHYRNNPCVVMWSIGNEVPSQSAPEGWKVAAWLQDICHREDPTRPVTCGMDRVDNVLANGFAALLDIPGFNYRTFKYVEGYQKLPQGFLLGSETASAVSSRGVYHFPVERGFSVKSPDHQSNGYDTEACSWSNIPDIDFALADDYPWTMGQFVWTGFDYLGEPSPYDTDGWPSHSSVFGIIDLASLPKDRFYLYRSVWNKTSETLHVLPHWTWPDREGKVTPVFVYTSYPSAELFVNGVSQGVRSKQPAASLTQGIQTEVLEDRYRLMWDDAVYHKGEIRVVAYDASGAPAAEKVVKTAGRPYALKLTPASGNVLDGRKLPRDGAEIAYVTVSVVDRNGVEVPCAADEVSVEVSGPADFRAVANGDPACLELFHLPHMHLFAGKMSVLVQSREDDSDAPVVLTVKAKGLKSATLEL